MSYRLLAISGSLRKGSFNTSLIRAVTALAPEGMNVEIADISSIPIYNQDHESAFPAEAAALKEKIMAADGIVVATPEYNRAVPGVLKNVVDWTSRPYGHNAWDGKAVYVMGASGGPIAAALAQYNLKQTMLYLNAHVLGQPEFYCGMAAGKFDESGQLTDEKTKEFITQTALPAFARHMDMVRGAKA